MSDTADRRSAGFTLIEVLVSLAILSISLAVLLSVFSDGMHRTKVTESEMIAGSLVQSLLAEAGVSKPLILGDEEGEYNNGFRWRLHVEPYGSPQEKAAWIVPAYKVTASVGWLDGQIVKWKKLTTLKLSPRMASK